MPGRDRYLDGLLEVANNPMGASICHLTANPLNKPRVQTDAEVTTVGQCSRCPSRVAILCTTSRKGMAARIDKKSFFDDAIGTDLWIDCKSLLPVEWAAGPFH
jgi:hypothetical protein